MHFVRRGLLRRDRIGPKEKGADSTNWALQPMLYPRIVHVSRPHARSARNAVPARRFEVRNTRCVVRMQITGSPEVALNQKVKNLIQKLGEAIHESVSESENIAGVVRNIREQGFDVLLMLEATIGLNEVDESEASDEAVEEQADGPFTLSDVSFLKSLRISLPDVEGAPGSTTLPLDGDSDPGQGPDADAGSKRR
jgi:hypothetical protein